MVEEWRQQDFLNALLAGKRLESTAIVMDELAKQKSVPSLYETIIKVALYQIGELWQSGRISVASEHLASAVVEAILNELYPRIISCDHTGKTVIAACIESELHQIGVRMVSDIFEVNGWSAHFLGADMPCADLLDFTRKVKPDALALSLSSSCRFPILEKAILAFHQEFPKLHIFIGGLAFHSGEQDFLSVHSDLHYIADLHQLDNWLKEDHDLNPHFPGSNVPANADRLSETDLINANLSTPLER